MRALRVPPSAWVAPTLRATQWRPLLSVTGCLALLAATAALLEQWSPVLVGLGAATLAAAVVAGLWDRAAELLAAVPTSEPVRRARRLLVLVPAALAAWLGYVAVGELATGSGWPVGPFAALLATGIAVAGCAPRRTAVTSGASAPLAWVGLALLPLGLEDAPARARDVVLAWQLHPWTVTAVAAVVVLVAARTERHR